MRLPRTIVPAPSPKFETHTTLNKEESDYEKPPKAGGVYVGVVDAAPSKLSICTSLPAVLYNATICLDPTRHFSPVHPIVKSRAYVGWTAVQQCSKKHNTDTASSTTITMPGPAKCPSDLKSAFGKCSDL